MAPECLKAPFNKCISMYKSHKGVSETFLLIIWIFFLFLISLCLFWKSSTIHPCRGSSSAAYLSFGGKEYISLGVGLSGRWDCNDVLICPECFSIAKFQLVYYPNCTVQNVLRPHSSSDPIPDTALLKEFWYYQKFSSPVFCSHTDKNF